jgi:Rieske 2Fe-2S family protein
VTGSSRLGNGFIASELESARMNFVKARLEAFTKTLPRDAYCSDDVFAQERERIFARAWCGVTREEWLPLPGDYVVVEVAGESLIVTRDSAFAVRAYANICRHRGTRLCTEASGNFNGSIRCPYHAWTYGLDGTLLAARHMGEVGGFERADYPLHEVSVATFDGFVFVNLGPDPVPFASELAPTLERFSRWNVGALRVAAQIEYELACNWKLIFANYSECYHCPLVHPQLEERSPSDSGRNDLVSGPVLGGYSEMRPGSRSLTLSGTTPRPPLGGLSDADLRRSYYYTLFPSLLLSLHPDHVMVHFITPLAAGATRVVCAWLFDPATSAAPGFDPSDAVDFWDLTNRQDWHVNELTQLGVSSRFYEPGAYANQEGLLAAFDRHYTSTMQAG